MNFPIQANPVMRYKRSRYNTEMILGINASTFCTCIDGSVDINKCGKDRKPSCDVNECKCVVKNRPW